MLTEENLQDIFEIADLLSEGDREIFMYLKEVVFASDPNQILDLMEDILEPDSFDNFLDLIGKSEKENLWLILMTVLDHSNYICVQDYKGELEEFVSAFNRLQQVRKAGISLELDSGGLSQTGSFPEWAGVIDAKYRDEEFCLGAIDKDTGSYYLFFSRQATFDRLQELVGNIGYCVYYAKNM